MVFVVGRHTRIIRMSGEGENLYRKRWGAWCPRRVQHSRFDPSVDVLPPGAPHRHARRARSSSPPRGYVYKGCDACGEDRRLLTIQATAFPEAVPVNASFCKACITSIHSIQGDPEVVQFLSEDDEDEPQDEMHDVR